MCLFICKIRSVIGVKKRKVTSIYRLQTNACQLVAKRCIVICTCALQIIRKRVKLISGYSKKDVEKSGVNNEWNIK